MALTTLDQVIAGLSENAGVSRKYQRVWKTATTVPNQGSRLMSFWRLSSTWLPPIPAVAPITLDDTTLGAINNIAAPASGKSLYLVRLSFAGQAGGVVRMWDRLAHNGGLAANVTTLQTLSPAMTLPARASSWTDVQMFIEIYSNIGGTATTATITYTNSSGVSGRTATVQIPSGTANPSLTLEATLQSGDTGVQSVQSVQLAASTGGVGNYGITLARPIEPLVNMSRAAGDGTNVALDVFRTGVPVVDPAMCTWFTMLSANTGSVTNPAISFNLVEA